MKIINFILMVILFTGCSMINTQNNLDIDKASLDDAKNIALQYSMSTYLIDRKAMLNYESEHEIKRVARQLKKEYLNQNKLDIESMSDNEIILEKLKDITDRQKEYFSNRGKNNESFEIVQISLKNGTLTIFTELSQSLLAKLTSNLRYNIQLKMINNRWQVIELTSTDHDYAAFRSADIQYKLKNDPRIKMATEYANEKVTEVINSEKGQNLKNKLTNDLRDNDSVKKMRELVSEEEKFKSNVRQQLLSQMSSEQRNNLTLEEKEAMEKQIDVLYNKMKDSPFFRN